MLIPWDSSRDIRLPSYASTGSCWNLEGQNNALAYHFSSKPILVFARVHFLCRVFLKYWWWDRCRTSLSSNYSKSRSWRMHFHRSKNDFRTISLMLITSTRCNALTKVGTAIGTLNTVAVIGKFKIFSSHKPMLKLQLQRYLFTSHLCHIRRKHICTSHYWFTCFCYYWIECGEWTRLLIHARLMHARNTVDIGHSVVFRRWCAKRRSPSDRAISLLPETRIAG